VFPLSLQSFRASANSHLAEVYGIVCQLLLARDSASTSSAHPIILSDHLNSINLLNDRSKTTPQRLFLHPARSLYRWILKILDSGANTDAEAHRSIVGKEVAVLGSSSPVPFSPLLSYVRAHTDSDSTASQLNRLVDFVATHAHRHLCPPPVAPLPTFTMDDYTPHTTALGLFDGPVLPLVEHALAALHAPRPNQRVIFYSLYDPHPPPEYHYTRTLSAYSALIQFYARSDQLDSAIHLHTRMRDGHQPWCRFHCVTLESAHHIFTQCPHFASLRQDSSQSLTHLVAITFESFRSSLDRHPRFRCLIDSLFVGSNLWPCGTSLYYRGLLPPLATLIDDTSLGSLTALQHRRLLRRLANDCHAASIRLACRIWGIVRRSFSPYRHNITTPTQQQQKTVHLPSILSHVTSSPASRLIIIHDTA
jgi:hypothetical protein